MIAALICFFKGHKRGKYAPEIDGTFGQRPMRCPRCKATWTRKAKTSPPQSASS